MSGALSSLPKNVRSLPSVERLVSQVSSARKRAGELREVAKDAVSPARATAGIQAGAFAHGVVQAVAGERWATTAQWSVALAAFATGLVAESPDAIMFANGMLAPISAEKGFQLARRSNTEWRPEAK